MEGWYDQWFCRRRERRTKTISARHFCFRSPMSLSRKWTRKSEKRYNPSLWADLSRRICDKKFISTLHKNNSFVRRLQNCVKWYGPFSPWHPSFNILGFFDYIYQMMTRKGGGMINGLSCLVYSHHGWDWNGFSWYEYSKFRQWKCWKNFFFLAFNNCKWFFIKGYCFVIDYSEQYAWKI